MDGLKLPVCTPGPEYTPPAGVPPDKAKGVLLTQTAFRGENVTAGGVLSDMLIVAVPVHPLISVPVTVYVVATDGAAVTVAPDDVFKPLVGLQE